MNASIVVVAKWNADCAWWNVMFVFLSTVSRYVLSRFIRHSFTDQWSPEMEWNILRELIAQRVGFTDTVGHPIGEKCLNPERATEDDFTVISAHGIQSIGLDFCGCGKSSQDHVIQLLRIRLFPATIKYPKMAATFDCLKTFKKLSYVSKLSAFEFYQTASRLTDDTGTKTPKVS